MTQETLTFVEQCEQETRDQFEHFSNDKAFMDARVKELVDVVIATTKRSIELEDSGATQEEIVEAQKKQVFEMADKQLEAMRDIYSELAPARHARMKVLSAMSLEEFKEANFEITKREMKVMSDFSQKLMIAAEHPLVEAMDKLEDELDAQEEASSSGAPIFNINGGDIVN